MLVGAPRRGRWRSAMLGGSLAQRFGRPSALWLPGNYEATSDAIVDQGSSQVGLRFGATTAAETSDPVLLDHSGDDYLYLPGVAQNYASLPDPGTFTDLDVIVDVVCNWQTGVSERIMTRWQVAGSQRSWAVQVGGGAIRLYVSSSGTDTGSTWGVSSGGVVPFADGERGWLRVTYDASAGDVTFYTSTDGVNWSVQSTSSQTPTPLFASTAPVMVGNIDTGNNVFNGRFYYASAASSIGGAPLAEFVPATAVADGWTINRGTSGLFATIVDRPAFMTDGASDYAEATTSNTSHEPGSGSFTALWVGEVLSGGGSDRQMVAKPGGWSLAKLTSGNWQVSATSGGTTTASVAGPAFGVPAAAGGVVDRGSDLLRVWASGATASASIAGLGSVSSASPVAAGPLTAPPRMVCYGVALWPRALTDSELAKYANLIRPGVV